MLPIQALLTLSIVAMAWSDPARALWPVACAAHRAGFFFPPARTSSSTPGASKAFPASLQAAALGAYTWGYRIAMLCSGSGAIWLAARGGWHRSLLAMALLSLVGPMLAWLAPEPALPMEAAAPAGWRAALRRRVAAPFRDLLGRPSAWIVIAFVLVFNLGTQLADTMAYPLYHALGFKPTAVAAANGVPSLCAALAGAAFSGVLVARIGIGRALILCACIQMSSILLYVALVHTGPVFPMLFAKVTLEGFAEVLAATTFATYLSRLCSLEYTATQYALLSSLAPVAWRTLGGTTGFLAEGFGWTGFYLLTAAACLPGILIMSILLRRFPGGLPPARPASEGGPVMAR